jgi:hypothetical protein
MAEIRAYHAVVGKVMDAGTLKAISPSVVPADLAALDQIVENWPP